MMISVEKNGTKAYTEYQRLNRLGLEKGREREVQFILVMLCSDA